MVGDDNQVFSDDHLVAQCGFQNDDNLRMAKAKHKRINPRPWPVVRRQEKANKLREELNPIEATEEKVAFDKH